jgi:polygalacturonase
MNLINKLLVVVTMISLSSLCLHAGDYPYEYLYKDLPFSMPRVMIPEFPDRSITLTEAGGVGDGYVLNTNAFEKAISTLASKGGGTVIVPFGVWLTGPIVLQSNIRLHLEKGSLLLFTPDKNAYPLVSTNFEGLSTMRCQSPISGKNLVNIAITGEGAINGSGESWRPLKRSKVTDSHWKRVLASGGVLKDKDYWFPSEGSLKGEMLSDQNLNVPRKPMTDAEWLEIRDFLRPVMVSLVECTNVYLQGVLFENSPSWNIHPLMCENVIIDGVFVRNPSFSQNGDGIDLESCKNALIVNSVLDVGDDAICIKSGKDEEGRRRGRPTENVIVDNCRVFKGHGGFVVGSEMSGGVRNISVTNCSFIGTNIGLRFKSTRGRGGVVENIYVSNVSMVDIVNEAFLFDLYYMGAKGANVEVPPADETTPVFRNIFVRNIVANGASKAMFFNGLPEMNISNIVVENSTFTTQKGAELSESAGIRFKNVQLNPIEGPAVNLYNVRNFRAEELHYPEKLKKPVEISGEKSKNIQLPEKKLLCK